MKDLIKSPKANFWKLGMLDKYLDGHNGFVAGGCFKNILNGEKAKDIDIFFESESDFQKALKIYQKQKDYSLKYENDNCVAFVRKNGVVVELCRNTFLPMQELLARFDFSIARAAYVKSINSEDEEEFFFYRSARFFEDLHQKRLVIEQSPEEIPFPANTFERALKYTKYGYGLCKESKLKLIHALRQMPENFDISNSLYNGFD